MPTTIPVPPRRGLRLVLPVILAAGFGALGIAVAVLATGALQAPGAQEPGAALEAPVEVVIAAGDIAGCDWEADEETAALLDDIAGTVLVLGDTTYPDGSAEAFDECYAPTWGRHLDRTRPVPGNHDYEAAGAVPYFTYFGERAGRAGEGWYSFDLGEWHLVALNSECEMLADGCGEDSAQVRWLREDLAASGATCTLAFTHRPRFSSGYHGDDEDLAALWQALHEARADVVLAGHEHDYERLGPLGPDGRPDRAGMRSFVIGTGGTGLRPFETTRPGSQVRDAEHHGVLRLVLEDGAFAWSFVATDGTAVDEGRARCRA